MFGLENLPFPVKFIIAGAVDIADALNMIPGSDLVEAPVLGFIAYALTDNPKALAADAVDGILPAPVDFIPTTTLLVVLDETGHL